MYRLGRGDYYYTISELTGLGVSTVCDIVIEVCSAIMRNLWNNAVHSKFPVSEEQFRECIEAMDQEWQFPAAFAAIDGCHLPIKCPSGGAEFAKEYHNFKNFYSVVLMALDDAHTRFVWASV